MLTIQSAHSGFSVDDQEKARNFYSSVLGLAIREEEGGMGFHIDLPGGSDVFFYGKPNHQPATYTMLNLVVDNIDDAVETLLGSGVVFERYESGPLTTDEKGIARGRAANMGPDIAWFKDPAGNILSVMEGT